MAHEFDPFSFTPSPVGHPSGRKVSQNDAHRAAHPPPPPPPPPASRQNIPTSTASSTRGIGSMSAYQSHPSNMYAANPSSAEMPVHQQQYQQQHQYQQQPHPHPPPPPDYLGPSQQVPMKPGGPNTMPADFQNLSIGNRRPSGSIASSRGSRSSHSTIGGSSILNDKSFAPPPPKPKSLEVTKNQWYGQQKEVMSTLPQYDKVKHSGNLLARFSLKSMMIKKWRPTFWIAYGNHQLLFFRSMIDFEEWASNPFLKKQERDELVKLSVDFKNDLHLPNMHGYKVSKVHSKVFARDGYMHHFKLEKWLTYGPAICAAFGGKNEYEVTSLRTIMIAMIDLSPQNVKSEISDVSSFYSSGASDYNSSELGSDYSGYSGKSGYSGNSGKGMGLKPIGIFQQFKQEAAENGFLEKNFGAPKQRKRLSLSRKKQVEGGGFAQFAYESDGNAVPGGAPNSYSYDYDSADAGRSPYASGTDTGRSQPSRKSSKSPFNRLMRSKSKEPKENSQRSYTFEEGVGWKEDKSKKKEPSAGGKPSILRRGSRKNKRQEEEVQYYVGRPSDQQNFQYGAHS